MLGGFEAFGLSAVGLCATCRRPVPEMLVTDLGADVDTDLAAEDLGAAIEPEPAAGVAAVLAGTSVARDPLELRRVVGWSSPVGGGTLRRPLVPNSGAPAASA